MNSSMVDFKVDDRLCQMFKKSTTAASPVISVLLICVYIIFLYYLNLTCRIIALKAITLHRSRHYRSGDESRSYMCI